MTHIVFPTRTLASKTTALPGGSEDPDLGRLAQLLQQKAVESLGAAASGQRPAEAPS